MLLSNLKDLSQYLVFSFGVHQLSCALLTDKYLPAALMHYFQNMQKWCKACVLLEGLNRGLPKLGIGRTRGVGTENGKDMKQSNPAKSIESKQCGSLDF